MICMRDKKYFDFKLYCLVGGLLIIISVFLPWLSEISLYDLYLLYSSIQIQDSFLYLFPLISGIICFLGGCLLMYNEDYRLNSIIVNFIGLGFLLFFLFDFIPKEIDFLVRANIGFYFCILGFLLIIIYLINILFMQEKRR